MSNTYVGVVHALLPKFFVDMVNGLPDVSEDDGFKCRPFTVIIHKYVFATTQHTQRSITPFILSSFDKIERKTTTTTTATTHSLVLF